MCVVFGTTSVQIQIIKVKKKMDFVTDRDGNRKKSLIRQPAEKIEGHT